MVWIEVSFFACRYLLVPAPFVEQNIVSPLSYLCPSVENQSSRYAGVYFCVLHSVLGVYLTMFTSETHCLHYCSFFNVVKSWS